MLAVVHFHLWSIVCSTIVCSFLQGLYPTSKIQADTLSTEDIRIVVPFETRHSQQYTDPESYKHSIATQWAPTAISDLGMLSGIFLYACRSLHILTKNHCYYELALRYKLECLRLLQEVLTSSSVTAITIDAVIPRALQLASDEVPKSVPALERFCPANTLP